MATPTHSPNYNLAQFLGNCAYDSVAEMQRWSAVDKNLAAAVGIIGDGVIEGWNLTYSGLDITVSAGKGIITKLSCKSTDNNTVTLTSGMNQYYIVAQKTVTSYYDESVTFSAYSSVPIDGIPLGIVTITDGAISAIDGSVKQLITLNDQLIAKIGELLQTHIHDGTQSPKIDLSTNVTGTLSSDRLGDIPFSKITGNIYDKLTGTVSHNDLLHTGHYNHLALDDFVNTIATYSYKSMGELVTANHLQDTITLVHALGVEALNYTLNKKAVVPGISPSTGWEPTISTAYVDQINHQIQGTYAASHVATNINRIWAGENGIDGFLGKDSSDNYYNPNSNVKFNTSDELQLLDTASLPQYMTEGIFTADFDGGVNNTNWQKILWSMNIATEVASMWVRFQLAGNDGEFSTDETRYSSKYSITASSVDLTDVANSSWIRTQFGYYTASAGYTPELASIAIEYNTGYDSQYSYKMINTQDDFKLNSSSASLIDYETLSGALILDSYKNYYNSGKITSTYLDGSPTIMNWEFLYTDMLLPDGANIAWYARNATTTDNFIDVNAGWTTLEAAYEGIYDLTPFKYQYLQLHADLLSTDTGITPELLDFYCSYNEIAATNTATMLAYKRWTLNGNGSDSYFNSEMINGVKYDYSINNIATHSYVGGLTVLDPTKKQAKWSSAPYITPQTKNNLISKKPYAIWNNVKIYGENFSVNNVNAIIYFSDTVANGWSDGATWSCATSPCIIDMATLSMQPFATKAYMKLDLVFDNQDF